MRLDNLQIRSKIILVIATMAIVVVVGCAYAAKQMLAIDDAYSDLIARVNVSSTNASVGTRMLTQYGYLAYKLAAETTDEGNARMIAALKASETEYMSLSKNIREVLPEYIEKTTAVDNLVTAAIKPARVRLTSPLKPTGQRILSKPPCVSKQNVTHRWMQRSLRKGNFQRP